MADPVDAANELAQRQLQDALDKQTQPDVTLSRHQCLDCEEPIPEQRQALLPGVQRCVDCQELHEAR